MSSINLKISNSSIAVGSNASYSVTGSNDVISMGTNSTLLATGSDLVINVSGTGDIVTIGGNGQWATDANDEYVTFQSGGVLNELANSRADVRGSHVSATMTQNDTLGIYGSGDIVNATSTGDSVWVGQNGQYATAANIDTVNFASGGFLFELMGSMVVCNGSGVAATMTGNDALTAIGAAISVTVTGTQNILTIGGNGQWAADASDNLAHFASGGVLNELTNSRTDVYGDFVSATMSANDTLGLYGSGDSVTASQFGDNVWIGRNGQGARGAAIDTVTYSGTADVSPDFGLYELLNSNVVMQGSSVAAHLDTNDTLKIVGTGDYVLAQGPGDILTIGGNGQYSVYANGQDVDIVTSTYSIVVNELAGSNIIMGNPVAADGLASVINMGANSTLGIGIAGYDVNLFAQSGHDIINGFGGGDVLSLASKFSSINSLLAATSEAGGSSTIQLDNLGDSVTLMGVSKASVATFASSKAITFLS